MPKERMDSSVGADDEVLFSCTRASTGSCSPLCPFAEASFDDAEGRYWPSAMHFFYAHQFHETSIFEEIRMSGAEEAEDVVRRQIDKIRLDWEEEKEKVMRKALTLKVSRDADLQEALVSSSSSLLLHSHSLTDNYWGHGDGSGRNRVGGILDEIREDLLHERSTQEISAVLPKRGGRDKKRSKRKPPQSALYHADGTVTFDMVSSDTVRVTITDEELFVPMSAIPQKAKTLAHKYQWKKKYNRVDRQPEGEDDDGLEMSDEEEDQELACYMYRRDELSEESTNDAGEPPSDAMSKDDVVIEDWKMHMLKEMGFLDTTRNLTALLQADGSMEMAARLLLEPIA